MKISAILLSGGKGLRMGSPTPKQYLPLAGKPIALHSCETLIAYPAIAEVIVVCAEEYRSIFPTGCLFAEPGERRQDSVANGVRLTSGDFILVHDAARPFIDDKMIKELIEAGIHFGAATSALPLKFTAKRAQNGTVIETLNRNELYEIQTPQILKRELLEVGIKRADALGITVTDDVSFAELLNHPVRLIEGSEYNLKITTPLDLKLAHEIQACSQL